MRGHPERHAYLTGTENLDQLTLTGSTLGHHAFRRSRWIALALVAALGTGVGYGPANRPINRMSTGST